eukprot:m.85713 g.85713  ORF g.85713 m.85713 type:complete len:151 (+) comp19790_c0_seq1:3220-3672(+)
MQTVNKTMVGRPDPAAMHWESLSDIGDDFNHDDFDDAPARRSQSLGRLDAKQCAETTDADQQDWSVHGCAPAAKPIGTDNRELHPTTPPNSTSSPPTPETPVTIDDFADEVDSRTGCVHALRIYLYLPKPKLPLPRMYGIPRTWIWGVRA